MTDEYPNRKIHRLEGYDYSTPGHYCFTVCVKDRKRILSRVEPIFIPGTKNLYDCNLIISEIGEMIEEQWKKTSDCFTNVELGRYIIMPDHFHAILYIGENSVDRKGNKTSLSAIISSFKIITSKKYKTLMGSQNSLWQANYYDVILDTEKRYITEENYLVDNPIRWAARETADIKINY